MSTMDPPSIHHRRRRRKRREVMGALGWSGYWQLRRDNRRTRGDMMRRQTGWASKGGRGILSVSGVFFGLISALAGRSWVVDAQFVDGGAVSLTCSSCECAGTLDDGATVVVFDNPSSQERIVSVDGEYSEILETSCGTSIFAVGNTVYELSGIDDLESRDTEVLDMSSDTCVTADTPSTADCYTGPTTTLAFDDDVTVDVTFNFGTWADDKTYYRSKIATVVRGSSSVAQEIEEFCTENGFLTQMFTVTVLDTTFKYNFEFAIPGDPVSEDLSVSAGPSSTAGDFSCGEEIDPTPSPVETSPPVDAPTPAPAVAMTEAPATPAPSPGQSPAPTPSPSSVVTPAPISVGSPVDAPTSTGDSTTDVDIVGCDLPESSPCTEQTSIAKTNKGIGDYYDTECEYVEGEERAAGCDSDGSSMCRMCFFDTPLYAESSPDADIPEYPDCPCCVLEVYKVEEAANLDGPRCESVTPAPTTVTPGPVPDVEQRGVETLVFDDSGWEMSGVEAAALSALGLLAALTFFPFCSK